MSIDPIAFFVWLLGLAIGSFLNVVVYRLPRDLSVASPRWSFCPTCKRTLSWSENLPLLSWLLQVGRCRGCQQPIAAQYPLVEASTGLAFVLAYHLLLIEPSHTWISNPNLRTDGVFLLAWLVLLAAMVVSSAIDIVSYMVDTRVTDLATLLGIVCLAGWARPEITTSVGPTWSAAASAALLVGVARLYLMHNPAPEEEPPPIQESSAGGRTFGPGILLVLVLLMGVALACTVKGLVEPGAANPIPWLGIGLLTFVIIVAVSPERDADDELHEQIEEESGNARRMALGELGWLMPGILAGAVAGCLVAFVPAVGGVWESLLGWRPGGFAPVAGASYAMFGAVVAAAGGWFIRIGFTLLLGREAFGTGDIYIVAAAGACAGWEIALLGFLFAVGAAMVIWLALLLVKPTAMLAFGPPLAIGFLVALAAHGPATDRVMLVVGQLQEIAERDPRMLIWLVLFMTAALVAALGAVKLVRRMVEPTED